MKFPYSSSLIRSVFRPLFLASLLLIAAICEAAPPANDNLANAQVIPTDSFSVMGTEIGATQESFEQSPNFVDTYGYKLGASVWYTWTPSVSGTLDLTVVNDSNNGDTTAVFLLKGPDTPTQATFVAGTVPGSNSFNASVTAGQPYFFFVGNVATYAHPFTLNGTLTSTIPVATVLVKTPQAVRSTGAAAKVLVELSSTPSAAVTISYTLGGNAVNGTDYTMLSGSVTVPAGATKATIKIKPLAGTTGTAKLKLTVAPGEGYTVGSPAKGKVQIVD